MPRRLTERVLAVMYTLSDAGVSRVDVARMLQISPSTVSYRMRARDAGCKTVMEYRDDLAARQGFDDYVAYLDHLAQENGFSSGSAYRDALRRKKGFRSVNAQKAHVAREGGFPSLQSYERMKDVERRLRPEHVLFSAFIRHRLAEMGHTYAWLARTIEVRLQVVMTYATGTHLPRGERMQRIFEALEVPFSCIDDVVEHASRSA